MKKPYFISLVPDLRHTAVGAAHAILEDCEEAEDVAQETMLRMWENVETLLAEGGAGFGDVTQIVVYLRDGADYDVVRKMFEEKFPETPFVITLAPVCRPQWLIEMECMAIIPNDTREYRDF